MLTACWRRLIAIPNAAETPGYSSLSDLDADLPADRRQDIDDPAAERQGR